MLTLSVEHETDTAHRLSCHEGKCANLHGHRYKFIVTVDVNGTIEDGAEFLDFYNFKSRIKEILDELYDHGTVLKLCNENKLLIYVLRRSEQKVHLLREEPTVEVMAKYTATILKTLGMQNKLRSLTIYETPTNYCTWTEEEQ